MNACIESTITYTVLNNMALVPGVKFRADTYRNIAVIRHESTHRPLIVRDTRLQEIVSAVRGVHVGSTSMSRGERLRRGLVAEAAELNRAAARDCTAVAKSATAGCV